jgi:hypothetical protein
MNIFVSHPDGDSNFHGREDLEISRVLRIVRQLPRDILNHFRNGCTQNALTVGMDSAADIKFERGVNVRGNIA